MSSRATIVSMMLSLLLIAAFDLPAAMAQQAQPPPTPQQRAAMLKQWLAASQAQMRTYEWIETTTVSVKGEVKSTQQKRCYYGADGVLQKVPVSEAQEKSGGPPGILAPGRLVKMAEAHKKEELTAYMKSAAELIHSYVPPDPAVIQQVVQGGRLGMQMLEPGKRVRLDFADYRKPGDKLGVEIEMPTNRLLGLAVNSYLEKPEDSITLKVTMSVLPDGTIFAQHSVLDAPAEKLSVSIENSGYRRLGQ